MAYMEIIISEDILGKKTGEVVRVRAGYGRNYLIPMGLAVEATLKNKARMEHEKRVVSSRRAKLVKTAEDLKARLEAMTLSIPKRTGEGDKLYGSVTTKELQAALEAQGLTVDRKIFVMSETIKTTGVHQVTCRLTQSVTASLKVWVISEN
ncbi:50S ribosomal protein L9 [Myxococcota bacterium]|jgi:large subunit ribosomal protein L9|nr:50S ribosomal protein L9 [Myxococcota bacterium]MBU1510415.1 50S ribosomal protein L9 [Myxococcota bacterium]PKN24793.1 MAG: 50S ribosomal protein L9 [Deltaproteobacteria bacterium HGW-Deltaproteobacteria-22]